MEGKAYLYNKDLTKKLSEFLLPAGVSGKIIFKDNNFYFVSNKGVLYSMSIFQK